MQPYNDGPRAAYTLTQVAYLIEQAAELVVTPGLELLTGLDLNLSADISDIMLAGSVSRDCYAMIHGSATFTLDQPLDWGSSLVRPYMTLTGQTSPTSALTTMKFYQGVFFTDSPSTDTGQMPYTHDVTGYDILSILDDAVGDDLTIDVGVDPLDQVEEILTSRGVRVYSIDRDAAGSLITSPIVYAMSDNVTWLTVVNDLLAYVGYQGIWTDWNGVFRAQVYHTPADRGSEWLLTADIADTLITQRRKISKDFYNAPNRWVFYRSNNTDSTQPTDGAGRFEYVNQYVGETSVEARGGRILSKVVGVDAVDQNALVSRAQITIDADTQIPTAFEVEIAPLPLAWHFDKYTVNDPALGPLQDVLGSKWALNLDGADSAHSWTVVA